MRDEAMETFAVDRHGGEDGYEPCPKCLWSTRVTRWDNWNGFAVECPRCHTFSGPHWSMGRLKRAAFAAILLNVLVLIFMTRPRRFLGVVMLHAAIIAALAYLAHFADSETFETLAFGWFFLGPLALVAFEHVRHEVILDRNPASQPLVSSRPTADGYRQH